MLKKIILLVLPLITLVISFFVSWNMVNRVASKMIAAECPNVAPVAWACYEAMYSFVDTIKYTLHSTIVLSFIISFTLFSLTKKKSYLFYTTIVHVLVFVISIPVMQFLGFSTIF